LIFYILNLFFSFILFSICCKKFYERTLSSIQLLNLSINDVNLVVHSWRCSYLWYFWIKSFSLKLSSASFKHFLITSVIFCSILRSYWKMSIPRAFLFSYESFGNYFANYFAIEYLDDLRLSAINVKLYFKLNIIDIIHKIVINWY